MFMNEFRLFALGEEFDVDRFVKRSSLEFSRIWHRGYRKPSCGTSRYPTSGCVIDLGDGLTLPLPQQEHVARDFLVVQVA